MRASPWAPHPWGNRLVMPTRGLYAGIAMMPDSALARCLGYGGEIAPAVLDRSPVIEPGREPDPADPNDWRSLVEVNAPFPWFGGKRRVADVVWRAFGTDCPNYIEPFAGSLAVLLARPGGPGKIETVNDRDRYLANFWRAVSADPIAVAEAADWPVNEADLHARHKWLVNQVEFRERMHTDPDFFDVKIAGWWVWGLCQWIGGGWCVEPKNHKHPRLDGIGKGVHSLRGQRSEANDRKRPELDGTAPGRGVHSDAAHRKLPSLGARGDGNRGVHSEPARTRGADRASEANRPELAGAGKGIHSGSTRQKQQLPDLAVTTTNGMAAGKGVHARRGGGIQHGRPRPNLNSGQGVHMLGVGDVAAYSPGRRPRLETNGDGVHLPSLGNDRGLNGVAAAPCAEWFLALQERLRRVRVACGDWQRVLGDSVLGKGKNVGGRRPCAVFLDPPYAHEFRDPYLYSEDDASVSAKVREWALEHGDDPDLRIALCGYSGEHDMPGNWTEHAWKGARGYAAEGNNNRELERIWFSPHCLPLESRQLSMF